MGQVEGLRLDSLGSTKLRKEYLISRYKADLLGSTKDSRLFSGLIMTSGPWVWIRNKECVATSAQKSQLLHVVNIPTSFYAFKIM